MTNDERDKLIMETHDVVIALLPMTKEHHRSLYGNGNMGLEKKTTLLEQKQTDCPARAAYTMNNKRYNIALVLVVVAIISLLASVTLGIITIVK